MQKIKIRSQIDGRVRKVTERAFNLLPSVQHNGVTYPRMGFVKLKGEPINLKDVKPTFDEGDSNAKDFNQSQTTKASETNKVEQAIANGDYTGVTGNELSEYITANYPNENAKQPKKALFELLTEKLS